MFGIGGTEFFIIALFVLLLFGPDKLPEVGRTIGKWTKEFRRAQDQMTAQIKAEMEGLEEATNPFSEKKSDGKPSKVVSQNVDPEWDEEEDEE